MWLRHARPGTLRTAADRIYGRTHATAYYDRWRYSMCFGYEVGGVPVLLDIRVPLRRDSGADAGFDATLDVYSEDTVVTLIQLAKISPEVKAKWEKWHAASKKADADQHLGKTIEESHKGTRERVEYKYQKHTMGRHWRRSHVVNGLKGA